jgi:hypothetical protein
VSKIFDSHVTEDSYLSIRCGDVNLPTRTFLRASKVAA